MIDLKDVASDLSTFLATVKQPPKQAGISKSESTSLLPPKVAVDDSTVRYKALVRATFDYVTSRLTEEDDARTIGESFMLSVTALARDANVPVGALNSIAIDFLEDIVSVAREGL